MRMVMGYTPVSTTWVSCRTPCMFRVGPLCPEPCCPPRKEVYSAGMNRCFVMHMWKSSVAVCECWAAVLPMWCARRLPPAAAY